MQALCEHYPDAQKIRVVLDNLSTHSPAALYQSLAVEEARSMTRRLEFHYTPKHASWLNMRAGPTGRDGPLGAVYPKTVPFCPRQAEIEWSALERQCLGQRLDSLERLRSEVGEVK